MSCLLKFASACFSRAGRDFPSNSVTQIISLRRPDHLTFPPAEANLPTPIFEEFRMNSGVSKKKLFISNLDFEVTSEQLREIFEEVGPCLSVVVAADRETKRSKGFAFVEMEREEDANTAITTLNNRSVNGRPMKVCEDRGKNGGQSSSEGGEGPRKFEPLPSIQRMQLFKRRKKLDPFTDDPTKTVDYRDVSMLSKFVSERGRILSRRLTGLSSYNQRKVSKAIKRAQALGLMAYTTVQHNR